MTAMPISMGLPRQSFIFWRELFRVITLREIFLLADWAAAAETSGAERFSDSPFAEPPSTSPLWLSLVLAAGFTPTQKGLTK